MNALPDALLQYRSMCLDDLDAVLRLEQSCYAHPWTRGNFVDSLAAGYESELALDPVAGLVAYRVAMVGVDEMHLLNLTVHPDRQGRGQGRRMLQRLVDDCARLALATLWLEVRPSNQRALLLYARWGFQEVGLRRGYYPAAAGQREDAIVMKLPVPRTAANDAPH